MEAQNYSFWKDFTYIPTNSLKRYPGVDGRIILKCIFKMWDGGMDWIHLAQDRNMWLSRVSAVMNIRVP
jgi:hypothetical protein